MDSTWAYSHCRALRDVQLMLRYHYKILVARISRNKHIPTSQLLLRLMQLCEGDVAYDILIVVRDIALADRVEIEQSQVLSQSVAVVYAE